MNSRITSYGLPVALLSASLFAACQNTARGVERDAEKNAAAAREDAREAGNAAERAADNAAQATRNAGEAARDAAHDAADKSREAGHTVGGTIDAAQQTMQIKTALIDADNIDAGGIDVDTSSDTKTVTLKGHVPTAAQKSAAERVAKEKAPGYKVVNQLEVKP
jgi:osmotically-inducible protein OsmY